jgi:pimeloyl-ACP methyl ester carboxylesterase
LWLHGSGGGRFQWGDSYLAIGDRSMGFEDEMPFAFNVRNGDGSGLGFVNVMPVSKVRSPRGDIECLWFGYQHGPDPKHAYPYDEIRLDALHSWLVGRLPQIDAASAVLAGSSMGAWGCLSYGLRRPDLYAAVFADRPRWRAGTIADWERGTSVRADRSLTLPDGTNFHERMDMVRYVRDRANRLPFIAWSVGRHDVFSPWDANVEAVEALRAARRGFTFAWNNGNHSDGHRAMDAIRHSYRRELFRVGRGYPVLSNSSRDSALSERSGGINLGFHWRNVHESERRWSCELTNVNGETEVDVLPYGSVFPGNPPPCRVRIPAGTWVEVSFQH